ncbi:MAG: hypothetical protein IPL52_00755 [Flavobacteriales bacterium]|nr:hypothetical protein [Flavobacteriales bacterium]
MHKSLLLIPMLSALFAPGCYYDNEEELYPNSFCDTVNVNYGGGIKSIIDASCAIPGCHVAGGTGTGDFTDFNQLIGQIQNGRLLPSIRRDASAIPMPPSGALRDCELRRIELWVAAGAQNN